MSDVSDKGQRVELGGALAGHYIRVNVDALDCGVIEDMESGKVGKILAAFASLIVGGDLPHGHDHAGLRKLKPDQLTAIALAIPELFTVPKPS